MSLLIVLLVANCRNFQIETVQDIFIFVVTLICVLFRLLCFVVNFALFYLDDNNDSKETEAKILGEYLDVIISTIF